MTNVKQYILEELKSYIENGGTVLITHDTALRKDEYDNDSDEALVEYIYQHSDKGKTVVDKIKEMGLSEVVLVDAETGEQIQGVEWAYAQYEDTMVVNIVNYDLKASVTAKILYHGKEITDYKELRDFVDMKNELEIKPYQPILIQFNL